MLCWLLAWIRAYIATATDWNFETNDQYKYIRFESVQSRQKRIFTTENNNAMRLKRVTIKTAPFCLKWTALPKRNETIVGSSTTKNCHRLAQIVARALAYTHTHRAFDKTQRYFKSNQFQNEMKEENERKTINSPIDREIYWFFFYFCSNRDRLT